MNFSVLLSVYIKENPAYFNFAMESIWHSQTLKPNEIILVEDGPLTLELYNAISDWKLILGNLLKIVKLKNNEGLAIALNKGLKKCSYDIVARMDTDDVANAQRFERQISFLVKNKNIDVVGTYIEEIDENGDGIRDVIKFPLTNKELFLFFSKRDPIAHPTAMFRKRYFENAGNYRTDLHLAEDTLLWYFGFLNDCKFANIDYVGVKFRRTKDFYMRRANKKKTIQLFKFRVNTINRNLNYGFQADVYAFVYLLISISPSFIKKIVYRILR